MKTTLEEVEIFLTNIHDTIQLSSSPWLLKKSEVILNLTKLLKRILIP